MNITEIVSLIVAITGLVGALITIFAKLIPLIKGLKDTVKFNSIYRMLQKITVQCEQTGENGETKLNMALGEVEILCKEVGIAFDKDEWAKNINDIVEYTKQVNYKINKSRAK